MRIIYLVLFMALTFFFLSSSAFVYGGEGTEPKMIFSDFTIFDFTTFAVGALALAGISYVLSAYRKNSTLPAPGSSIAIGLGAVAAIFAAVASLDTSGGAEGTVAPICFAAAVLGIGAVMVRSRTLYVYLIVIFCLIIGLSIIMSM